jgi:CDP-diglyceride synthetase
MYQPYPLGGQSAEPLRPPAPAPVLTAVKLMYAGAAVSAGNLIISLAVIGGLKAYHGRFLGHSLTAAQVSDLNTVIIAAVVTGLVVIALWLWMARANGQGRNWARILSTVLFGLATLELTPYVFGFGEVFGVTVFGLIFPLLTWLVGLAVVWLLWRPASSAFFRPQGITQAGSGAAISSRIRSSRARPPRQW